MAGGIDEIGDRVAIQDVILRYARAIGARQPAWPPGAGIRRGPGRSPS
ncbi:hypothetical protein L522_0651 [Bordetella bronchiseptica MBORD707]|nr:hypothetical protein L522_0651 [Bordetella bronchiseptica MBORD707]